MPVGGLKSEGRRSTMKVMLVGDPGEQRTQLKAVLAALAEPELEIIEGETATAANLSENVAAPPDATLVIQRQRGGCPELSPEPVGTFAAPKSARRA